MTDLFLQRTPRPFRTSITPSLKTQTKKARIPNAGLLHFWCGDRRTVVGREGPVLVRLEFSGYLFISLGIYKQISYPWLSMESNRGIIRLQSPLHKTLAQDDDKIKPFDSRTWQNIFRSPRRKGAIYIYGIANREFAMLHTTP